MVGSLVLSHEQCSTMVIYRNCCVPLKHEAEGSNSQLSTLCYSMIHYDSKFQCIWKLGSGSNNLYLNTQIVTTLRMCRVMDPATPCRHLQQLGAWLCLICYMHR